MTLFVASTRDSTLAQKIYTVYGKHLGDQLKAIIMCGGAGKPDAQDYASSDIDYLVIVIKLNTETMSGVSSAQEELGTMYAARPSHTVLTYGELLELPKLYLTLDGKAVQAVVEAESQDVAGMSIETLPRLSNDALRAFSTQNLYVLQALLRKTVVRAEPKLSNASKISMSKIALIVQKMHKQAVGDDTTQVWDGRSDLENLKLHPEEYTDESARALILKLLNLRVK